MNMTELRSYSKTGKHLTTTYLKDHIPMEMVNQIVQDLRIQGMDIRIFRQPKAQVTK